MRVAALLGLGLLALVALVVVLGAWIVKPALSDLPDLASLRNYRPPVVTSVWSRDGVLMAELFEQRRKVIDISTLPENVVQAFLSAEDRSFFAHEGLDWKGIVRAAWANLRKRRVVQGGSTITQQVAKSLLLSPERSLRRKVREAVLAVRIEKNLSKSEILHLYLNQIYLGHGAYGIESASEIYFGISSDKLSVEQAALLAGLPQAPSRYDPYRHPERSLERRRYALERMAEDGHLSAEEAGRLADQPLELSAVPNSYATVSPYFSEHVRRVLEERYGRETLLREGLRVVTTMDSRLQTAGRRALQKGLEALDRRTGYRGPVDRADPERPGLFADGPLPEPGQKAKALVVTASGDGLLVLVAGKQVEISAADLAWAVPKGAKLDEVFRPGDVVLCDFETATEGHLQARLTQEPEVEGALVCLDPRTGEVLACVGGYDFRRSQFNRAVQAKRQPGSAFKPLIFAAAVEKGYTPATVVYDIPVVVDSTSGEEKWKPLNYGKKFEGAMTLREALVRSINIVSTKVLRDIGVTYAVQRLQGFGMESPINQDLTLVLGSSSVSPLELVSMYAAFPGAGIKRDPAFFRSVADRDGNPLESFVPSKGKQVIRPDTAYVLTHMMQDVIRRGTGRSARGLERPCAGKTGTTNEHRDAWFIGYTPDLVAAVWVGYDEVQSLGSKQTGGRVAAPIWLDFMREAVAGRPVSDFAIPEGIEFARIDSETGEPAGPHSAKTFTAAFVRGTAPVPARTEDPQPARAVALDPTDPAASNALR